MKFAHQLDRIVAESDEDYAKQYVSYKKLKKELRHKNKALTKLFSLQSLVTEGDLSNTTSERNNYHAENSNKTDSVVEENKPRLFAETVVRDAGSVHSVVQQPVTSCPASGDVTEENVEEIVREDKKNILDEEEFAENIVYIDPKDAQFFHRLDEELEKVNRFFLPRVKALLERYEYLEKQESKSKMFSSFKSLAGKLFSTHSQKTRELGERLENDSQVRHCNGTVKNPSQTTTVACSSSVDLNKKMEDNVAYIEKLNSTVEVYKEALRLLKYVNVNITAFRKILKKHDKLCELSVGRQYLRLKVESQPFVHSALAKTLEELGCRGSIVVSLVEKRPMMLCNMEEYQCPICISLLYKPMALPCGHRFCGKCISRAILLDFHCPVCRRDYSNGVRLERKKSLERFLRETFPQAWQKRKEEVIQDEKDRERLATDTPQINRARVTLADNRNGTDNNHEYMNACRLS